jgi:hypothetical protein
MGIKSCFGFIPPQFHVFKTAYSHDFRKTTLRTCGCSAIKNYVAKLHGGLNEQLEKEGVLLSTTSPRSAASHELIVLCHQIGEDIINGNVDTNRIKLSHRPNGEGGRRQP